MVKKESTEHHMNSLGFTDNSFIKHGNQVKGDLEDIQMRLPKYLLRIGKEAPKEAHVNIPQKLNIQTYNIKCKNESTEYGMQH